MGRKPKFSKEVKIDACERYINGHGSFESVAKEVGCSPEQFRQWYLKYQIHGASEFETKSTNQTYSKNFKLLVVESIKYV